MNFKRIGITLAIVVIVAVIIVFVVTNFIGIITGPMPIPAVLQTPDSTNPASELFKNPTPLPKFLTQVVNKLPLNPTNRPDYNLCAVVNEGAIAVPEISEPDVSNSIKKSFVMSIDGHKIPNLVFETSPIDSATTSTDSVSMETSACVNTKGMANGFYTASIQFAGTDGKQYSYTWAFQIATSQTQNP